MICVLKLYPALETTFYCSLWSNCKLFGTTHDVNNIFLPKALRCRHEYRGWNERLLSLLPCLCSGKLNFFYFLSVCDGLHNFLKFLGSWLMSILSLLGHSLQHSKTFTRARYLMQRYGPHVKTPASWANKVYFRRRIMSCLANNDTFPGHIIIITRDRFIILDFIFL